MLHTISINAQCNPATGMTLNQVGATCPSNGSITVSSVTPTASGSNVYLYQLKNSGGTIVSPWQTGTTFTALAPGSYTVEAKLYCTTSESSVYARSITLTNNARTLAFNTTLGAVTVERVDVGCGTGRIRININNKRPSDRFSLVNSMSANNDPINQVRAPRDTNLFDSLPAGTYYARVIDECGNSITSEFVINRFQPSATKPLSNLATKVLGCNQLEVKFQGLKDYVKINNTADATNVKLQITWPNGTTQEFTNFNATEATGYGGNSGVIYSGAVTTVIGMDKLDAN